MYRPNLKPVRSIPVPDVIVIGVLGGIANPQSWERGGRRASGMVPFERALVSSYSPSIVTFPLSLRVSEILPLLRSTFPHPTSSLFKISPCSRGSRWMVYGLRRAKVLGLSVQLVSKISNLCGPDSPTSQTDGRTDRRTTCNRKTALGS